MGVLKMEEQYYSQAGDREKIINKYLTKDPNKEIGTYVDIGGGHPLENSNTYYYYLRGWKGLVIEPCLCYHEMFEKVRPKDKFIRAAVGDFEGEGMMYSTIFEQSPVADKWKERLKDEPCHVLKVPVYTIDTIVNQNPDFSCPDFVDIDIEASEEKALSKCNFNIFKPQVLLIEWNMRGYDKEGKYETAHDYRSSWEHYILPYYDVGELFDNTLLYVRKKDEIC